MKKLFALLAIVFLCGYTFAQNNITAVSETGDDNTSYVNQLGGTTGNPNEAYITQTGDKNKADVSDLYPSSLYSALTGTKGITQSGLSNLGTINQSNSFGGAVSAGPIAGMGQYGNGNIAAIAQSGNTAWMQGYAWVKQEGNDNTSLQNQAGISYAFSHVYQIGNGNEAETQQPYGGYAQKSNIYQVGNGNEAFQQQGKVSGYTESNLAEATQFGDDNYSYQNQNGSTNTARTIQTSGMNHSYLIQNGNLNVARIEQKTDDLNTVNLTQSDGSNADILQDGYNNTVMGLLADPMATSLNGSYLDVDQVGNSNVLHLQQSNGSATVSQDGVTNTAVVIQQP